MKIYTGMIYILKGNKCLFVRTEDYDNFNKILKEKYQEIVKDKMVSYKYFVNKVLDKMILGEINIFNEIKQEIDMLDIHKYVIIQPMYGIKLAKEKEINIAGYKFIQKEYGKQHIQLLPKDLSFYTFDLFYDSLSKRDELIEAFQKELVINDHGGHGSCDCSTIGFDKGDGIAYLLNHFHIDKADAYAFGDGYNDQAMFREVGHAIAMGNAVEELKQKATYITDSIDCDGIMKALIHEGIA